jgi:cell division protease FtsH
MHNMAHALLDWETIDKYQIDELMAGKKLAPPEPAPEIASYEETAEISNTEDDQQYGQSGQLAMS